jgi:glycine cleavage system aminomethyltransferase T/glycine/D-amino acid oxidase-like deaminating enzyme
MTWTYPTVLLRQSRFISVQEHRKLSSFPKHANVVVIGGGIIGTSVAYHLAHRNIRDVILVERHQLTAGTTWHAAGLINTFGSMSMTSTHMRQYTKKLYSQILPNETGLDTGFRDIGFIELATDADHLHYYRRVAAFNRYCGVDVREITPDEIRDRFPLLRTEDVLAGFFVESDGRVNPHEATMSFARASQQKGVQIFQGIGVSSVQQSHHGLGSRLPHVTSVIMEDGSEITCNAVVNCAGMWARQLAEQNGVIVPNQAAEHYYLITDSIPEVDPSWPVVEDSANCVYIRPEGSGLMLGFFETLGAAWNTSQIPNNFSFGEIEPDWDRMMPYLQQAMERRLPAALHVGAKKFFCGPESFTPDNSPIVGPAPFLKGYYVAAGLNSIGILTGGGIGKVIANWIVTDGISPQDIDITSMQVNRFHPHQNNLKYRKERVVESLGNTYQLPYPDRQLQTCRGCFKTPYHERLANHGGQFRDVSGWESPSWYLQSSEEINLQNIPLTFGKPTWFKNWASEHSACRENVALFDMSFMSKFLVQGNDAGKFLNRLSTAQVNDDDNRITYTQWLNEMGFMEADVTITKLANDQFMVVATDTMRYHVHSHMLRRLSKEDHCFITDMTGSYAQLNLQGPRSRELLQTLTSRNMHDFPFRHAKIIDIDCFRVLCTRITYVGELGYELFIPVEQACAVFDLLLSVGNKFNLKLAGLKALQSLRLEKGYRDYGHDMDNTDTLLECGLAFTCDFNKPGGFIGQEHVENQMKSSKSQGGLFKRMANVLVKDPDALLIHGEVLWRNGHRISEIRGGSFGHTLGGAVGLSMLESKEVINKSWISDGEWQVEIADKLYPCDLSLSPFYDPKNLRVKD